MNGIDVAQKNQEIILHLSRHPFRCLLHAKDRPIAGGGKPAAANIDIVEVIAESAGRSENLL